jgi:hypothetical protein
MSSLQKFHRRTNVGAPPPPQWPPTVIGMGDDTHGYYLGTAGTGSQKLIIAPVTTEVQREWAFSYSTKVVTGATSTSDGLTNSNTAISSLSSAGAPAANYCRTLTTGGYNTWYLPAANELITIYSNIAATPFSTSNSLTGTFYWSSTEFNGTYAKTVQMLSGTIDNYWKWVPNRYVRAVRRY